MTSFMVHSLLLLLLCWSSSCVKATSSHLVAGTRRSMLLASRRRLSNPVLQASIASSKTRNSPASSKTRDQPYHRDEPPGSTADIYRNLNPIGKCVAGSIEIAFRTVLEYASGFIGGYMLGSVTDLPRFTFQPVQEANRNLPFLQELMGRYSRMHSKSLRWAKTWAGISATFGGCRVATKVLRGGIEDEWNTVISSAVAGAFFARNEGPQGMVRGALVYGGMVYFLSGGMSRKKAHFDFREQLLDS